VIDYRNFSFGLYEKALPDSLGWKERLRQTKEAGCTFVEISIDVSDERLERLDWNVEQKRELWEAVLETGVPVATLCLSGLARYPSGSSFADPRNKGNEIIEKAIYFARDLGIRIVQIAGYDSLNDEESTVETQSNFFTAMTRAFKLAARFGVHLAIENIGYTYMNSLETIMKYVDHFKSPFFSAYADIGNLHAANLDIRGEFETAKGHITAVHLKDAKNGVTRRVPFGEGTVDFLDAFRVIRDIGYLGPLVVEMWADDRDDALLAVKEAKNFLLEKMKIVWNEK
jgi:L-ribulose-5-phosphate 3-epimerase